MTVSNLNTQRNWFAEEETRKRKVLLEEVVCQTGEDSDGASGVGSAEPVADRGQMGVTSPSADQEEKTRRITYSRYTRCAQVVEKSLNVSIINGEGAEKFYRKYGDGSRKTS
jgi:hypothetical protein